jgi:hypothetical protein
MLVDGISSPIPFGIVSTVPMVDELNPFIYDDPLPPDALVDRDEETRKLLSLAEGGHNTRLSAPRGLVSHCASLFTG